ncbi:MAG: hypothetical protein AAF488_10410 [Planctomycetota bacterium]
MINSTQYKRTLYAVVASIQRADNDESLLRAQRAAEGALRAVTDHRVFRNVIGQEQGWPVTFESNLSKAGVGARFDLLVTDALEQLSRENPNPDQVSRTMLAMADMISVPNFGFGPLD